MRNRKPEYIKKMINTEAPNGYKFDLANYLYNPSFNYDYPSFMKMIEQTETTETYKRIYFFKYYDGEGEYFSETFTRKKNGDAWQVITDRVQISLEKSNRFNLKKLLSFCN